jgi:phage terminase large subunit GpA-like protein
MLYGWLRVAGNYDEPTPGYAHFPEERDAEYFIQLTAEKRKTKYRRGSGVPIRIWVLKHGVRNEALDCRVYAIAAKYGLNVPIEAVRKRNAKILQAQSEMEESADAVAKKKSRRPIKNKFMREITSL